MIHHWKLEGCPVNIFNIHQFPQQFADRFGDHSATLYLGKAAGSEKIYVNIDRIPPGSKSAKYHSHSKQEEFFMILGGTGTLRMNGEEIPVRKGDFVAKPAGRNIAHQFINTGQEMLEILDVGTNEDGDIAYYPDEDVYFLRKEKLVFSGGSALTDWDSDPNA
jgi:uncharacterized cupin superfamily protein